MKKWFDDDWYFIPLAPETTAQTEFLAYITSLDISGEKECRLKAKTEQLNVERLDVH